MVEIFQNIRRIYVFSKPCGELADYIEFFSESITDTSTYDLKAEFSSVKMFPSWTPTFYINLGTPYYIDLKNTRYKIGSDDDILILRNEDVTRHKLPADNIFTVKFYPGGLEAILGLNQAGLINQIINLSHILPAELLVKIKQPVSFEERVELMQSFLLTAYFKNHQQDHYLRMVNDCIGEYHATAMQLNTSAVAERLFITSKTINRYFNRVIGISPKSYFSILRARTALTAFVNHKDEFVPLDYGYYDLSHFHKDVIKFTGQKLMRSK
ncbi:AraC family transcriptional regulator [Pedobacter cryoconitis]|uniref:AraC-like DNA-binding protein n=1 Tax=Pedobacter cryoconitis TaxID=188932 RepID=A0A7X0J3E2_9SPHI|nr:helix-turn-helix domain-containing protein [Pedobacter cryoconitis]MBB6500168.1 AraC-like DNA-binding protein [Pedobacter cryoconitis]